MNSYAFSFSARIAGLLMMMMLCTHTGYAQTATKSTTPTTKDTTTKNEIKTKDQGKVVPRVALTGATDNTTIKGKSTNLLIYNTAKAGDKPNYVYPGYYHNVGTTEKPSWKRVEVTVSDAVKAKEQ